MEGERWGGVNWALKMVATMAVELGAMASTACKKIPLCPRFIEVSGK